ncbi:Cinnamate reductase [Moorella thermoacetica]|uniref:2-enoate reductase FldZ n=2 Tax=Neomoorella thermoacetica TaxID=1525 RepID=A0AAC9MVS8_NEOTH|nr:2-enoate reductase FldZ [Moorella thermoacetica]TYL15439.1 Cinnamate reductase [Moorella thermoacetica]
MVVAYTRLFEPIKIGKVEIKNKIAMAPMGVLGLATQDGCFSKRVVDYYVERAKGGTGLIITSVTKVDNEIERFKAGAVPVATVNPLHFIATAGELTERVHAYGTKIFLQLGMGFGRVAAPILLESQPVAPSAIPNFWDPSITCRELTTAEVETLVQRASEAAEIAVEAGFDGVEIHAMHEGYLLDQFTIALFNRRGDKYGGALEDRLTFPIEIVRAIKDRVGKDFPVVLRFSIKNYIKDWRQGGLPGENFQEKGRDVEEALAAAKILEGAGYDGFDADAGSYDAWYWAHPPVYQKHGCYLPLTQRLKEVVKVPVIVAGRLEIPELAEEALVKGQADMIAIGRGLLTDPYWVNKVMTGRSKNIRPCIGCHDGCLGRGFLGRPLSCTVNPACGREEEYAIDRAPEAKQVMVIGGGVAGMEAARVAALRGHRVSLYEKSDRLGGHVVEAAVPDFKADDGRLLEWYKTELGELQVEIHLNQEVTPDFVQQQNPDAVIVATGSTPAIPDIAGINKDKVTTVSDLLLGKKQAGGRVVIIGGGLAGCETALWLAQQGKDVTIIEILDDLMRAGIPVPYMNRMMLLDLLKMNGVKWLTETSVLEVTDDGVTLISKTYQRSTLPADTVILAVGFAADQRLYNALRDKIPNLYLIGDSREPRNILAAIWEGYEVGRGI